MYFLLLLLDLVHNLFVFRSEHRYHLLVFFLLFLASSLSFLLPIPHFSTLIFRFTQSPSHFLKTALCLLHKAAVLVSLKRYRCDIFLYFCSELQVLLVVCDKFENAAKCLFVISRVGHFSELQSPGGEHCFGVGSLLAEPVVVGLLFSEMGVARVEESIIFSRF